MTRRYSDLWKRIANKEAVTVEVHKSEAARLKKAIHKEKWLHKRARDLTGLPSFGKMQVITRDSDKPNRVKMTFQLTYSGDNL